MKDEIEKLVDGYLNWLRDKTSLREIDKKYVEITTPYLDRHNDYLQIYAHKSPGGFVLTDDGYTIDDLESSGCPIDSAKRTRLLTTTLNGFGIQLGEKHRDLRVFSTAETFPKNKHRLIQAMLAVNDLFYVAAPGVSDLFYEEVERWLREKEIRFVQGPSFVGKSGYTNHFEFVVPESKDRPERLIDIIAKPSKPTTEVLLFKWHDLKDLRPHNAVAYAFIGDHEKKSAHEAAAALRNYGIKAVPWKQRETVAAELAA